MTNYSNIFEEEAMIYENYRETIYLLMQEGKTTGEDHSEAMLHYTKMNNQRMNRVEKTTVLLPELVEVIHKIKNNYNFLVISEGWCGDAAQILPIFDLITKASRGKLKMKIIFRDQHLEIMDQYLTNGGRSIPVILVLDADYNLILPKWGPRPKVLQNLLTDWKKETADHDIQSERIHAWYAKDKTLTTQQELINYLSQLQ